MHFINSSSKIYEKLDIQLISLNNSENVSILDRKKYGHTIGEFNIIHFI